MANITQILFNFQEVAVLFLQKQDIHEGHWGLYLEFGFQGTNLTLPPAGNLCPAAVTYVTKIGIQRFPESNSLTVDAAAINPAPVELLRKPTLQ